MIDGRTERGPERLVVGRNHFDRDPLLEPVSRCHPAEEPTVFRENELERDLYLRELHIWRDRNEIEIGDRISGRIQEGLLQSYCFVIVLSPEALQFGYRTSILKHSQAAVVLEVEFALDPDGRSARIAVEILAGALCGPREDPQVLP